MEQQKKKKFAWLPLLAISAAYAAAYNPPAIRYFLYDSMLDAMKCSNMQLSFLTTIAVIMGIVLSVPGGWVADKFSMKKILIISLVWVFPLCLISVLFITTYWVQVVVWAGFGIATGFAFWPAVLKGVRMVGGDGDGSLAFGIFEAAQGLFATAGNFIALGVFARFIDETFGYRAAHLSMGVYALLAALLVAIFVKEEKKPAEKAEETVETEKFKISDTLVLLKNPSLWLVAATLFAVYGMYISQSYLTPYFTGVLGAALTFTGAFSIIRDYGAKVVGGPVAGLIAKKIGSPAVLNAACLAIAMCMIFLISRMEPGKGNVITIAMFFVLANAVILSMAKATMWATMDEAQIPMRLTGTATSLISPIGIMLPDGVMPLINGWLLDTYANDLPKAYNYYFMILFAICLLGIVTALLLFVRNRRYKKKLAMASGLQESSVL